MNVTPPAHPFDSNHAWQHALALIRANRDLLLALAGVFVVLPALAVAVVLPPPEPGQGVAPMAFIATLGEYYQRNAPVLVGASLVHVAGTLAMLALFTDRSRPTVGEAIRRGFTRLPTVILAQLVLGMAVGAMLLVPVMLGGAAKSPALTVVGVAAAIGLGLWAGIRLSLIPAAVMVEGLSNPLTAITRSWQLSEGNALRLLGFMALLTIAFMITSAVATGLVNALLAFVLSAKIADLAATLVAVCVQAAMTVIFTAVIAASYRQLAEAEPATS